MKERSERPMGRKRFMAKPVLFTLLAYHFFLVGYFFLVKQIRKSLLFP